MAVRNPGADGPADVPALMEALRQRTATREGLTLQVFDGPGGTSILVQEQQLENSDLIDEHWTDVFSPEEIRRRNVAMHRAREGLAVTLLVVAGDKAAGKTTFFAALTGGNLHILQAFRYNQASFFNVWYAPDLQELRALLDAPTRAEPYFQTALAHGFLHMPVAEFEFFADDDEFRSDGESPEGDEAMGPAEVAGQGLGGARGGEQNMLIKLLEVGGDFVQELMGLREAERAAPDATKLGILRNVMQYLQQCTSLAYFINVDAMFAVLPAAVRVDADKVRSTVAQLDFLNSVLPPGAGVLVYCSREPETLPAAGWCVPVVDTLFGLIAAQTDAPCPPALHEQAKVWEQAPEGALRHVLQWMLGAVATERNWTLRLRGFYPTKHLSADGEYDYSAVLRTLHRLLKTSTCMPLDNTGLVAQQIVNIAYDFWESDAVQARPSGSVWFTKDTLYEALQELEEGGGVQDVIHPMVMLPPMVMMDAFESIANFLAAEGVALRWHDGRTAHTRLGFEAPGRPAIVWRARPAPAGAQQCGFRLPLEPSVRRMIRGAVDLMSTADGLSGFALAESLAADLPGVMQVLEARVADAWERLGSVLASEAAAAPSAEASAEALFPQAEARLQALVWLVEEWALLGALQHRNSGPTPGQSQRRTLQLQPPASEVVWQALGCRVGMDPVAAEGLAPAVDVVLCVG